ncbi:MAG: class I SAM-dependent methyltransferase [Planctomycetota bacterium]|nr:MAG: class I SAM-dependent methyltransferase [Planctomycetota bacterium]
MGRIGLEHPFCPRCFASIGQAAACPSCALPFDRSGALLDVLGSRARERRAEEVERFYTKSPFPGYAPGDDGASLLDRSRRAPFLVALDAAIAPDARVLDLGCGTAQVPAFLALAASHRTVVGIDGCRESLAHAEEFRARAVVDNLQLVRADLFDLPVEPRSFQVVISRGVVHHTPDPDDAIAKVAECVAPGGVLVLGWYETAGRLFHCARRALGRLRGQPIRALDPLLRRRDMDDEKKRIWIEDQYLHPLEHILPLPHVLPLLDSLGLHWIRSIPPATRGEGLFDPTPRPSAMGIRRLQLAWALRGLNDPDAGLVCVVARRA